MPRDVHPDLPSMAPLRPEPPPGQLGQLGDGEVDPELLALPDPPRRERTLTVVVLALAAVLALAMTVTLRREVSYALTLSSGAGPAVDLGDLHAVSADVLAGAENRYVRAEALLGVAGGIRYERPLVDDSFRTLQVAGRPDVWVDVRVPSGQENGRWEPPRALSGRLVRFEHAGPAHRGLAGAIERASHTQVPAGAWLLVDGESPAGGRWAVLLALTFLCGAAWNVLAIARIVRRVR